MVRFMPKTIAPPVPAPRPRSVPAILSIECRPPQTSQRLRDYIARAGVAFVQRHLGLSRITVGSWKRRGTYSRIPSVHAGRKLIVLSHVHPFDIGPLTYDDLWGAVVPERKVRRVR